MRVRIKKIPQARTGYQVQGALSNDVPAFGGADYNAYIGEKPSEVRRTISKVPRHMANLEAEGGETVVGNLDGSSMPSTFIIKGPRHSSGGVPLNLPDDSFIFSDTNSMKISDPKILKMFGVSAKKGGYTPAELSKKYDINKYRKILQDPNSDKMDRKTAEMMIKNYVMKLGALALAQESKKGFPQDIPLISKPYMEANGIKEEDLLPMSNPQQGSQMMPQQEQMSQEMPTQMPNGEPIAQPQSMEEDMMEQEQTMAFGGFFKGKKNKRNTIINNNYYGYDPSEQMGYIGNYDNAISSGMKSEYNNSDFVKNINPSSNTEGFARFSDGSFSSEGYTPPAGYAYGGVPMAAYGMSMGGYDMPFYQPGGEFNTLLDKINKKQISREEAQAELSKFKSSDVGLDNLNNAELLLNALPTKAILDKGKYKVSPRKNEYIDAPKVSQKAIKNDDGGYGVISNTQKAIQNLYNNFPDLVLKEFGNELEVKNGVINFKKKVPLNVKNKKILNLQAAMDKRMRASAQVILNDNTGLFNDEQKKEAKRYLDTETFLQDKKSAKTDAEKIRLYDEQLGNFTSGRYSLGLDLVTKDDKKILEEAGINTISQLKDNEAVYNKLSKQSQERLDEIRKIKGDDSDFFIDTFESVPETPVTPKTPVTSSEEVEETEDELIEEPITPQQVREPEWWLQDTIGTMGAFGDRMKLKKYMPWAPKVDLQTAQPSFLDPTRELAANAEQANIQTQGMGQFAGPQALSARSSSIQGEAAKNAANILSKYNNANVNLANQFAMQNANINNQEQLTNQGITQKLYDQNTIANQQYDNAKRQAMANLRQAYTTGITNKWKTDALNQMYPNYQVSPGVGGRVSYVPTDKTVTASAAEKTYGQKLKDLVSSGWDKESAQKFIIEQYKNESKMKSGGTPGYIYTDWPIFL